MNPNDILVWLQIGGTLVQVAKGSIDAITDALGGDGIEADNAQLDKVNALYDARIAQADSAAGTSGK